MSLKDTTKTMHSLLTKIGYDLVKAEKGNLTAAQRVRTATIKLEKVAKRYRKESLEASKIGKTSRKPIARSRKKTIRRSRKTALKV